MSEPGAANRLRQRLWGAAVLIAIAVIVLPLLLDGAGSESQFRRVEQLREEPPAKELQLPTRSLTQPPSQPVREVKEVPEEEKALEEKRETSDTPHLALTAWVVQAGAFVAEKDALAVRDQLRRAGFASFVRDRDADSDPFRVLVGPMIREQSAEKARKSVAELLQNDPIIMSYP